MEAEYSQSSSKKRKIAEKRKAEEEVIKGNFIQNIVLCAIEIRIGYDYIILPQKKEEKVKRTRVN